MKRIWFAVAVATVAVGATAVWAQSDPIATRQATMKKVGGASAEIGKMIKGEEPFDAAKVHAGLATMQDAAKTMPSLFPDNSKTGGKTAALPKIWETKADFDARFAKLGATAGDANGKITDLASLKAEFPAVGKNCGDCHETYRAKKS